MYGECGDERLSNAPLETPSHNGEWKGKLPVRTIPTGIMSEDPDINRTKALKSVENMRRLRVANSTHCRQCGKELEMRQTYFCCEEHRQIWYNRNRKDKRRRRKSRRPTKWQ